MNNLFNGKNFDFKKVIEWLGYILKCPICGHKYNLGNTQVIDTEHDEIFGDAKIVIHSDCGKCKSSVMFNVEIRGPEVFSVGMVTDLTSGDSSKFKKKKAITANEVLNIHQEIRSFKGNLIELLTKK
jgi:hypothetical protein